MDILQARNEILAQFRTAWLADDDSKNVPVMYPDLPAQKPPATGAWARVTIQHVTGAQTSLAGATGSRRFTKTGFIVVQVFTIFGEGQTLSDQLTQIAQEVFEGVTTSPGRVMFRNVRVTEAGQDGQWFQVNVTADFEYDEVK